MPKEKIYWKGLEELHQTSEFQHLRENEFAQAPTAEEILGAGPDFTTGRRDFLKFLGFSVSAATLAACEAPVHKALPYVVKPENVIPGVPLYFNTTFFDDNDFASVLVKTREGRPILIESINPQLKGTRGLTARIAASVLGLYDSKRQKTATYKGEAIDWKKADESIVENLNSLMSSGKEVAILSNTIISPSTLEALRLFRQKFPNVRHVVYDPVSYSAIRKAHERTHGKAIIPTYRFDKALSIASFGADFIGTWLDNSAYSTQFSQTRHPDGPMSRLFSFETIMTLTGAKADYRTAVKQTELAASIIHLYNKLTGSNLSAPPVECSEALDRCAQHLLAHKGQALVVCGINDPDVQILVNEINKFLGAYGNTIDINTPVYLRQGDEQQTSALLSDIKAGKVGGLILYNANPVYNHPAGEEWASAIEKLPLSITFADRPDESGKYCQFILPDHHYLESWNDFNPWEGFYTLAQPTIHPLFDTRAAQENFLVWAGLAERGDKNSTVYREFIKNYWRNNLFNRQNTFTTFDEFWYTCVHDGFFSVGVAPQVAGTGKNSRSQSASKNSEDESGIIIFSDIEPASQGPSSTSTAPPAGTSLGQPVDAALCSSAAQAIAKKFTPREGYEVVLYQKVGIGCGQQAANPWLQELPDPISRVTWDNYITMSPEEMRELGFSTYIGQNDPADVAELEVNGKKVKLPVVASPGQKKGTVGVALGYGRKFGKGEEVIGVNVFGWIPSVEGFHWGFVTGGTLTKTGETYPMAATQTHHTMMGRPIVKETSLAQYRENPASGNHHPTFHTKLKKLKGKEVHGHLTAEEADFYKKFDRPNHNWGMVIDLNACNGCGACVIACHAENNVPVVGKDEIRRVREMHWLRIDRYYSSDMTIEKAEQEGLGAVEKFARMEIPSENPQVVFQPVMCQHCAQAPCENVCPVLATTHSNEGINQMTYNRCIGTRYCANNCPYKVRRFNWFKYHDNEKFDFYMNDDLGKMVLNPDVTVRSRGVMEKCSFCQQRIQYAKLEAKKEKRPVRDGEVVTACMAACAQGAILFGDYNDPHSMVAQRRKEPRTYQLLEELGTEPNVVYQVLVRNVEERYYHPHEEEHGEALNVPDHNTSNSDHPHSQAHH
ncbi:MAG: TAT-variant-translocated molybdopterin oxidoreductase [Flavobacteriales bacterium]|nr:TAT-variant-translocated molybdopterin oxidoreductase [Flavobacteriales bacterium]MDW8410006.1 TAT-variant-translocated molybdopterin oxidoreductase [Flavobacteriales bacterium]